MPLNWYELQNLATKYDLRANSGTMLDQGQQGACVENAIVKSIDMEMRLAGHSVEPLSRQQLYADERTSIGRFSTDSGSIPSDTFRLASTSGIASESSWHYGVDNEFNHPTAEVVAEAAQHKITSYAELSPYVDKPTMVAEVKYCLSQGKSVVLSFAVRNYFMAESGSLATQVGHDDSVVIGHHCVNIVGVDDNLNGGSYIVQNSWGTSWGERGYGTISYSQMMAKPATTGLNWDLDSMYVINGFNGIDLTYSANRVTMATDYAVALHRPGDIGGIDWWANQVTKGATSIQLLDALISSKEGQLIYGNETNSQFVDSTYMSVLGRHADAGGLVWWTDQLDHGCTRGTLMAGMIEDVKTHVTDIVAHNYLMDLTNISSYVSIAMQYDGTMHANEAAHALALVTSDATSTEIIKIGIQHDFGIM